MILGIDEVGRGPWAGPLVVGAVVLGDGTIDGLTDSKKLTKRKRQLLADAINATASVGLGWVSAREIDEIGLAAALKRATIDAVKQIQVPYQQIIIDGTVNFLADTGKADYVSVMKKADLLIASVSAASIVAKVARDTYMEEQAALYPQYGFASHVGYGTAQHRAAIEQYGVCAEHRLSFAPLTKYRHKGQASGFGGSQYGFVSAAAVSKHHTTQSRSSTITTKRIGDAAEDAAAYHLQTLGHTIIERNWKTQFCEVDIISLFNDVIYFTEVKYRKTSQQGGGVAAITSDKLRRMKRAAIAYAQRHKADDSDLRLQVASLCGEPVVFDELLELD